MRLIDADALNEALGVGKECADCQYSVRGGFCIGGDLGVACEAIADAPTVEPQHIKGRWTKAYDGYDGHVKCVQCFKTYDWDTQAQYYNFCPNCGADMRGEQDG